VVADALSRRPHIFSLVTLKVSLREHVLAQLLGLSQYSSIVQCYTNVFFSSFIDINWK
jgi:hypothetical protein